MLKFIPRVSRDRVDQAAVRGWHSLSSYVRATILVALFERSYINIYAPNLTGRQLRRWRSWEDYMRDWCRRADFRAALPSLTGAGDPEFVAYLARIAREEAEAPGTPRATIPATEGR